VCSFDPGNPSPFAEEFRAFALAEAASPTPKGAILFYGSSSIRLWASLADDFPGIAVVNRGFGGSTIRECVEEFDRLVAPLEPDVIVLYAGENDLDQGCSPEDVAKHTEHFITLARERFGPIPILLLTIKPSPARMGNVGRIRATNALLHQIAGRHPRTHLVDVFPRMLHTDGSPRHEYFCEDWLHLCPAGYQLWSEMVRERLVKLGLTIQ
jgi:lysophospholipase L1-like esterase